jgi:hypothetical protein
MIYYRNNGSAFGLPCIHPTKGATTEDAMNLKLLLSTAVIAAVLVTAGAQAQGTLRGAEEGADQGGRAAGPIGAIIGGAVGAATGTVGAILGVDDRPRFREYTIRERRPSYRYSEDLRVGVALPDDGVTYYEMPPEYRAPDYRYTYVNDRVVIVDPRTRRVMEIID